MSNAQHKNALLTLGEYGPPEFSKSLKDLHKFYADYRGLDLADLQAALREVPGYIINNDVYRTTDGYGWFHGAPIMVEGYGRMLILFPWKEDRERSDGTSTDRHIALYRGEVPKNMADDAIHMVQIGLRQELDKQANSVDPRVMGPQPLSEEGRRETLIWIALGAIALVAVIAVGLVVSGTIHF